ncbi:MAG: hypothetical protein IJ446_07225 [Oscillospiraceae bacterium]|nr:hypothetical protein [Oscillospiraceae bacterium]
MNNNSAVYQSDYHIRYSDCGSNGRLTVSALMRICSDAAVDDFDEHQLTRDFLLEHDMLFMLSKLSAGITKLPSAGDRIRIYTWVQAVDKLIFHRGFIVESENGEVAFQATSDWILLEASTKKIRRTSDFTFPVETDPMLIPDCAPNGRIHFGFYEKCGNYPVKREHIDSNGHMNNAVYGDIIMDFLTDDEFDREMKNIRVNFSSELTLGSSAEIFKGNDGDKLYICGKNEGKTSFEAEILYN